MALGQRGRRSRAGWNGEERKGVGTTVAIRVRPKAIQTAAPKDQDMTYRKMKFKHYDEGGASVPHLKRSSPSTRGRPGLAENHNRLCANFALVNLDYASQTAWPCLD